MSMEFVAKIWMILQDAQRDRRRKEFLPLIFAMGTLKSHINQQEISTIDILTRC